MAVGFEWQSGWKIYKSANPPGPHQATVYFPKNTVLKTGEGWKLVTDGADMEFVVDQAGLNLRAERGLAIDGETTLLARMRAVELFAADLDALHGNASINRLHNIRLFRTFPTEFVIVPFPANDTLRGFVQVTGGVRMSKLRSFFKAIGTADSQGALDFLGTYHSAYSATLRKVHLAKGQFQDTQWPGHAPSKKLRALVEMIALYMHQFRMKGGGKAKVVKYMTFIMARTNFGRLFSEIDLAEITHYSNDPDAWVRYICVDIMTQVGGFPPAGADPDGRLIEYPINDMDALDDQHMVNIPITRREWLKGMTRGRDVLTEAANPIGRAHPINRGNYRDQFGNHRLRGLGALGTKMDTVVMDGLADNQGAIFEFRGQQPNIPYTDWKAYTVRVYRFLQTVNFETQNA